MIARFLRTILNLSSCDRVKRALVHSAKREFGGIQFLELALVLPGLVLFTFILSEPLIYNHRYNKVNKILTDLANEARGNKGFQQDFWLTGAGYGNFRVARDHLASVFTSRMKGVTGVVAKQITHLDKIGPDTVYKESPLGYFPPGTSGFIEAWNNASINNSHACTFVAPGSSKESREKEGNAAVRKGLRRWDLPSPYKGVIGSRAECQAVEFKEEARESELKLTFQSGVYPTEISAAVEISGLLGTYPAVVSVPFWPYVSEQASLSVTSCTPSWKPSGVLNSNNTCTYLNGSCGEGRIASSEIDGCGNSRPSLSSTVCFGPPCPTPTRTPTPSFVPTVAQTPTPTPTVIITVISDMGRNGSTPTATPTQVPASGPTNTPAPTATPAPTNTPAPTPTPTRTPTPLNCYQIAVQDGGTGGRSSARNGSFPSCFTQVIEEASRAWLDQTVGYLGAVEVNNRVDDRVACQLLGRNTEWYCFNDGLSSSDADKGTFNLRDNFTAFLSESCQVIQQPNGQVCMNGSYTVNPSPISLVWSDEGAPEDGFTLSTFPLDPSQPIGRQYEWRASDKFPLLVWDPNRSGSITSASQLFGNHTFGKVWKHGYDALKSVDGNKDGVLQGTELSSLSLWFDSNKNGVSETGEVKTLSNVGVISIFVSPDRTDEKTGWVHASRGFERLIDGRREIRPSVDWFGRAYTGTASAIAGSSGTAEAENSDTSTKKGTPAAILDDASKTGTIKKTSGISENKSEVAGTEKAVVGLWLWSKNPAPPSVAGKVGDGVIMVKASPQGGLMGMSFLELPLEKGGNGIERAVMGFPLEGSYDGAKEGGEQGYRLVVTDNKTGFKTASSVLLSRDGQTLKGRSISEGPRGKLEYDWTAVRMGEPR